MSVVEGFTERNAGFAQDGFDAGLKIMPTARTIIIGCVDPRVDPGEVLGLEPGETAVVRNVGGRVTPGLLAELVMLRKVTQAAGGDLAAGWNLVVLQHSDCGITRLDGSPELLSSFFGVAEDELVAKAIHDPRAAVALDVAALRAEPGLAGETLVSGLVYDVATGLVETVVAPAPIRQ
jgi:carbonic anhydrase